MSVWGSFLPRTDFLNKRCLIEDKGPYLLGHIWLNCQPVSATVKQATRRRCTLVAPHRSVPSVSKQVRSLMTKSYRGSEGLTKAAWWGGRHRQGSVVRKRPAPITPLGGFCYHPGSTAQAPPMQMTSSRGYKKNLFFERWFLWLLS